VRVRQPDQYASVDRKRHTTSRSTRAGSSSSSYSPTGTAAAAARPLSSRSAASASSARSYGTKRWSWCTADTGFTLIPRPASAAVTRASNPTPASCESTRSVIHAHGYSPATPSRTASSSGSTSVRPSSSTNAATAAAGTRASRGTVANTYRPGRSSGSSPASNSGSVVT
jgi:hypothetical protein